MCKRGKRSLKIVVVCTGAGGHLVAGLAIAQALKNKLVDVNLFFLGSRNFRAKELTAIALLFGAKGFCQSLDLL